MDSYDANLVAVRAERLGEVQRSLAASACSRNGWRTTSRDVR